MLTCKIAYKKSSELLCSEPEGGGGGGCGSVRECGFVGVADARDGGGGGGDV